ncbi:hypothetical protein PS720_04956 [Pseudomonas fluorescens]|nr:hypothetical protein PS720_04956 [Pseudomonas fluorescens]
MGEHVAASGGVEQAQVAKRCLRVCEHLHQQVMQVAAQSSDLLRAESGLVVAELQAQAGAQLDPQRQRIVGLLMVVQAAEGQAGGRTLFQGFGHREVFEHQQGVEQRSALLPRPALDVVERHMFVVAQAQVEGLQFAQPAGHRQRRRGRADNGQRVDEQAQLLFDPRQRCRAPRHRGTKGHAVLPGIALQQQAPGALKHGVEGDFVAAGKLAEGTREVVAQQHLMLSHAFAFGRYTQRLRQQGWRLQRCQGGFPERLARGLLLQPAQVIAELPQRRRHGVPGVMSDDFTEQLGITPAVHEDVVAGEDQVPGRTGTAYQHQAKQRRCIQCETFLALGHGERIAIGVDVFDHVQLHIDLALDHLVRAVQAEPVEAAAQDVMAVQRGLPGTAERQQVQAFDVQAQLVDISLGLRCIEGVEQHALLHRRQWVEIGNRRPSDGQAIQLLLGQACQREVRRRDLPRRRGATVFDQGLEFRRVVIGQALDRRHLEHLAAEPPLQGQFTAIHLPFHGQPVGQRRLRVLGLATALGGWDEQRRLVELAVELAQVVEGDAWRGQGRQRFAGVRGAEVAQQAVTNAFVRHGAQLFLHRFDRRRQLAIGMQAHGEQAGEPTDGAAQVNRVEQVFAAMAFQLDQRGGLLAPAADDPHQRSQQQVVDLGAVGRRGVLQQLPGVFGTEADFERVAQVILQAALGVVAGQIGTRGLRLPIRQLLVQRLRMALQLLRPQLVGAGLGRQRSVAVSLLQVFEQDAPRHAVHRQVMHHQQQALGAVGHHGQDRAQQRALFEVETALRLVAQCGQLGLVSDVGLPQRSGGNRLGVSLLPTVCLLHKPQAQGVVVVDQPGQGGLKARGLKGFTRGQQQRLVPVLTRRDRLLEKAVLHGREDHFAGHRSLIDSRRLLEGRYPRQTAHALVLEQVPWAEANACLAGTADHLDGDDRIAAQFEKVVVQADRFHTQHIAPDRRDGFLQVVFRSDKGLLWRGIRQWQGLAVELAVGGHGQLGQGHHMAGYHVLGQAAEQPGFEVDRRGVLQHQVRHQLLAALDQHHGFAHRGVLHQTCLDLAQFDTQATQLDLMIEAPQVFDHPVGALAYAVAGAIQTRAITEGARHKTLGSQGRASMVTACQASAAQVQLAADAGRHRVELGVEHVGAEVGDGPADGHAVGAFVDAGPVGHVDGGLGWPIEVEQTGLWQLGEHLQLRIQWQGFAAAHDAPEAGAGLHTGLMDKRLEHRRHEVRGGDAMLPDGLDQPRRLTVFTGGRHHQARAGHQRPEELPHRDVEAERGFLQHRITGVQAIGLLHPAQAVDQCAMAVAGALGLAGGAGGVDHVSEVQRVQADLRRLSAVAIEPAGGAVQSHHLDAIDRQQRQQALLAEQQLNAAVLDHVGQAFLRVFGVERDIGTARLENRQQADHHFDGALDADPHQHVRAYTLLAQGVGQLVGARVQLGVGQRGCTEHQCRRTGGGLHLVFDQVVNAALGRVHLGGLVPRVDQQLLFICGHHRQLADALFTLGDHGLQQADPVPGHACDGRRVEQVIGVGQRGVQGAGFFIGVEGQVELGGTALPLHQRQLQAGGGADASNVGHHRLVVVHDLEQRRMAQAALDLERFHQPLERQLLMGLGPQCVFLDALQQLSDTGLPGQLGAQDLGVDEKADQAFDFRAVAVGDRHADADIALPGVTMQQHVEGTEQQHKQGDVVLLRTGAQLRGQLRVDRKFMPRALIARHGRAWAVGGQLQHRVLITQARLPVLQLTRLLAGFEPTALPQGVVAVLDRQRRQLWGLAALMGVVAADELVDQHVHRPAVGDDVVQGQQQHVLQGVELEQLHAQQRTVFQVERQQRLTGRSGVDGLFTLAGGQMAQIELLDGQRRVGRHLQQAFIRLALEHGAQGFVARDQAGKRLLQRIQAQRALEPHGTRQVVGPAGRVQLPEKPHALLRVGQRLAILHLHPCRNRKPGKVHAFFLQGLQEQLALFQGQPDKPASKFQGVFSIHFLESGAIGRKHKGTSSL